MNDSQDFEGKNVEQAIEKACRELNVSREELVYDIVSYGSTGIFGLVRTKKALIRVALPQSEAAGGGGEEEPASSGNEPEGQTEENNRSAINELIDEAFGSEPAEEEAEVSEEPGDGAVTAEACPESVVTLARSLVYEILRVLSSEAEVSVKNEKGKCRIFINGGDAAILIGRKGQTLEAIQYLVDKVVNRHAGRDCRVVVDVEGYLESRRNELVEMAARLADKAKKTGRPSTMNRMNAHDRRIVHLALKNNKSVRTQSVGEGYYRKLMIMPRRRKGSSKTSGRSRQNS